MHFARYEDGQQTKMPIFPGQRGPDVVRSLQEIEHTFRRNLVILKDIKHTILDVKVTKSSIGSIAKKVLGIYSTLPLMCKICRLHQSCSIRKIVGY